MSDMYYEEYDDQDSTDFDFIGVMGEDPIPITDIQSQVAEFRRLRGKDVSIYVYRRDIPCTVGT